MWTAIRRRLGQKGRLAWIASHAASVATVLLIGLYVHAQRSFDQDIPDVDLKYRMEGQFNIPGRAALHITTLSSPPAELLRAMDGVGSVIRLIRRRRIFSRGDEAFSEEAAFTDPGVADYFGLEMIAGRPPDTDNWATSLMLSETAAVKTFGSAEAAVGETLLVNFEESFRVVGVFADLGADSHMRMHYVLPLRPREFESMLGSWMQASIYTYVAFRDAAAAQRVIGQLTDLVARHMPPEYPQAGAVPPEEYFAINARPVAAIHIDSPSFGAIKPRADTTVLNFLTQIALVILAVTFINYTGNVASDHLAARHEIGMRKVVGAADSDFARRALADGGLNAFLIAGLGAALAAIAFRPVNRLLDLGLAPTPRLDGPIPWLFGGIALALLGLGAVTGYLVTRRVNPAEVVSAAKGHSRARLLPRAVVASLQYAAISALLLMTLALDTQRRHLASLDLGYEIDDILVARLTGANQAATLSEAARDRLSEIPGVIGLTRSSRYPFERRQQNVHMRRPGFEEDAQSFEMISVDPGFFAVYDMEFLAGRALSRDYSTDRFRMPETPGVSPQATSVILNARGVRALGYSSPDAAIGQPVSFDPIDAHFYDAVIVGVVADAQTRSFTEDILPTVYYDNPAEYSRWSFRASPGNVGRVRDAIAATWKEAFPETILGLQPLAGIVRSANDDSRRGTWLLGTASMAAIAISIAGILALAGALVRARLREAAIRKVFGATPRHLLRRTATVLIAPVLFGCAIGLTAGHIASAEWLKGFAEVAHVGPWGYGLIVVVVGAIGLGLVVTELMRILRVAPAEILRT